MLLRVKATVRKKERLKMLQMCKRSLHHGVLIAALVVVTKDLSSRGGAHAWSYNYSISPNRRWQEARTWCQAHFIDMVPIQNQEETDFLHSLLPPNSNHYWIGVHRVGEKWIWAASNQTVPDEAQNWATNEPDSKAGKDCVEIYVHRNVDTAKWNDENCLRRKGTICYSASCAQDSCSAHADCVETIGSFGCRCHPGFQGLSCDDAVACDPLLDPERGSHYCFNPFGSSRFNSSCRFHCELGFRLVGASELLCQASGRWSHPVPLCQVQQCPALNDSSVGAGRLICSHPIAPYSYNSTCELVCREGHEHRGQEQIRCGSNGLWTASVPACTKKLCPSLLFPVPGNMTCADTVEPFSFGSNCSFTCQEGFHLSGDRTLGCLASGQWSGPTPACTVVRCTRLQAPPNGSVQCQDPTHSYGSVCTMSCHEGFDLIGTNVTKCSSGGNWSHTFPVCRARSCPLLAEDPQHGRMSCIHPHSPFSFGSRCDFTCTEGFWVRGLTAIRCNSSGHWSKGPPTCQPLQCGTIRAFSSRMSMNCSHPLGNFSFGSRCEFTCKEGFSLNGSEALFCSSTGSWSHRLPKCTVVGLPLGTAMLIYTGVGAASVLLPIILIVLTLWFIRQQKRRANAIINDEQAWEEQENPAFEF